MDEEKKTIVVSLEVWKELSRRKANNNEPDLDAVLRDILKLNVKK